MCARFVLAAAEKQILQAYAAELAEEEEYKRNWNIAPTDTTLVITAQISQHLLRNLCTLALSHTFRHHQPG